MTNKTMDLDKAAVFLKMHPETLRRKTKRGEIPGKKPGKNWTFSQLALERYLAGEWTPQVVQGDMKEESPCHSLNEVVARTGISGCTSREVEIQYRAALAPQTKGKQRNSMTA